MKSRSRRAELHRDYLVNTAGELRRRDYREISATVNLNLVMG